MDDNGNDEDDELEEGEVQWVTVHSACVQTGGPNEAGKKLITTKCVQKLGDATARLKVMAPFFQLEDMRDHMRKLLAAYAALSTHKHYNTVELV